MRHYAKHLNSFDGEHSHEWHGNPAWGVWHIVGIVIGIIILLALIGVCLSCLRSGSAYGGAVGVPGAVVY